MSANHRPPSATQGRAGNVTGRESPTWEGLHQRPRQALHVGDVIRLCRHHPDRTVLLLVALYACWGSAIPAMKLMVATVPLVGGVALIFLLAGVVLVGAARGRPRPTRVHLVTALNLDVGRWMWWPSKLAHTPDPAPAELGHERADALAGA